MFKQVLPDDRKCCVLLRMGRPQEQDANAEQQDARDRLSHALLSFLK